MFYLLGNIRVHIGSYSDDVGITFLLGSHSSPGSSCWPSATTTTTTRSSSDDAIGYQWADFKCRQSICNFTQEFVTWSNLWTSTDQRIQRPIYSLGNVGIGVAWSVRLQMHLAPDIVYSPLYHSMYLLLTNSKALIPESLKAVKWEYVNNHFQGKYNITQSFSFVTQSNTQLKHVS